MEDYRIFKVQSVIDVPLLNYTTNDYNEETEEGLHELEDCELVIDVTEYRISGTYCEFQIKFKTDENENYHKVDFGLSYKGLLCLKNSIDLAIKLKEENNKINGKL